MSRTHDHRAVVSRGVPTQSYTAPGRPFRPCCRAPRADVPVGSKDPPHNLALVTARFMLTSLLSGALAATGVDERT